MVGVLSVMEKLGLVAFAPGIGSGIVEYVDVTTPRERLALVVAYESEHPPLPLLFETPYDDDDTFDETGAKQDDCNATSGGVDSTHAATVAQA